jgi:hypothetical protein
MIENDDLVFAKAFDSLLHRIQTKVASLAA